MEVLSRSLLLLMMMMMMINIIVIITVGTASISEQSKQSNSAMKFLKSLSRRVLSSKNLKDRSESTRTVSLEEEEEQENELLSHRRVRFSAQEPTYYRYPYYGTSTSGVVQDEDHDSEMILWYDAANIKIFQRDSIHRVQQKQQPLDDNDDGSAMVVTCIMAAHEACQTINTRQGMEDLMLMAKRHAVSLSSPSSSSYTSIVGLEKWITTEIQKSRIQQRQQLLRNVRRLQTKKNKPSSSSSSSSRESELRSQCVRASQPARLFAQYLAVLVQHTNDNE